MSLRPSANLVIGVRLTTQGTIEDSDIPSPTDIEVTKRHGAPFHSYSLETYGTGEIDDQQFFGFSVSASDEFDQAFEAIELSIVNRMAEDISEVMRDRLGYDGHISLFVVLSKS